MVSKLSEKKLLTATILCAAGIFLTLNNTVTFSERLISEKVLLLEVSEICLTILGAITLYKSFEPQLVLSTGFEVMISPTAKSDIRFVGEAAHFFFRSTPTKG